MAAATAPAVEQPTKTAPDKEDPRWFPLMRLSCLLTIDLPMPGLKVRDFLALHAGSIVGTRWAATRDVPLRINGILVGWGEMEGSTNRLAVRVTELA